MSANYLQTLKWHGDADLTKHIVQFYTKARAVESLSGFYESVAQVSLFYFSAIRLFLFTYVRAIGLTSPVLCTG